MSTVRYSSAGGVVIDAGKMLLLNRPSRCEVRLPKGHIEEGESPHQAALRETVEEAGYSNLKILADLGSQIVEFDYQNDHYVRTEHYFLMALRSQAQQPRPVHDEKDFQVQWVPLDEAAARLTYAAEQAVARKAIEAHRQK